MYIEDFIINCGAEYKINLPADTKIMAGERITEGTIRVTVLRPQSWLGINTFKITPYRAGWTVEEGSEYVFSTGDEHWFVTKE